MKALLLGGLGLMYLLILVWVLTGCASLPGVTITEEEKKMCEQQGDCTVWAPSQLRDLIRHFFNEGRKVGGGRTI